MEDLIMVEERCECGGRLHRIWSGAERPGIRCLDCEEIVWAPTAPLILEVVH